MRLADCLLPSGDHLFECGCDFGARVATQVCCNEPGHQRDDKVFFVDHISLKVQVDVVEALLLALQIFGYNVLQELADQVLQGLLLGILEFVVVISGLLVLK